MERVRLARLGSYRYELISAINGAAILILELVGARMIAPRFGTSIYVWTAIIGVVLGALAFGYWYGGKLADRLANDKTLATLSLFAAVVLLLSLVIQQPILHLAELLPGGLRLQAFVAALLLFAPATVFMGMIPPYLVKLKLTNLAKTGKSVGSLYAAGTIGSLLGTFLAGDWLIAHFGSRAIGYSVVGLLIINSLLARQGVWLRGHLVLLVIVAATYFGYYNVSPVQPGRLLKDTNSAYSHLQIIDGVQNDRPVRWLATSRLWLQSGVYLDSPNQSVLSYVEPFLNIAQTQDSTKKVLVIGGGVYTVPQLMVERYPGSAVDVVEIDPKLDQLANQYFGFRPNPRIRIIHEDGRTFLNHNTNKYDLVLMDAFLDNSSPPFQLTTREAVAKIANSLNDSGVVVANIIAAQPGLKTDFLSSQYATYRHALPYVAIMQTDESPADPRYLRNFLLIGAHDQKAYEKLHTEFSGVFIKLPENYGRNSLVLSDDFAPVERLSQP